MVMVSLPRFQVPGLPAFGLPGAQKNINAANMALASKKLVFGVRLVELIFWRLSLPKTKE